MDFSYAETFPGPAADGYERLLHDAMIGDATLFIRTDEVEQAWRITDPFLMAWSEDGVPLAHYPAGTWGPHEAELLLAADLRRWADP
jgi:glucose-6-phosphate 1-dehydrogenase